MSDKVINITSNGIKQAIDDLVNENEVLQDKVYKLEDIIKEVREEMGNAKYISVDDSEAIIKHEKRILEILDKEENDKEMP